MSDIAVKVPDTLRDAFEDLKADDAAIHAKFANFAAVIHGEQKAVALKAKELWAEAFAVMALEGEWRYADGFMVPVVPMDAPHV